MLQLGLGAALTVRSALAGSARGPAAPWQRIAYRGSVSLGGWAGVPQQRSERPKPDPTACRLLAIHRFRQTAHRFLKGRSTPGEDQAVFQMLEIDKKSAGNGGGQFGNTGS